MGIEDNDEIILLIFPSKDILWSLIRTVSMRKS